MKKIWLLTSGLILLHASSWACTVCKTQQPKILQAFAHGAGPESKWDYLILATAVAVVVGTLAYSIRFLWRPGENNQDHIKRSILNPQWYE